MINVAPPLQYPRIVEEQGQGATFASAAALTALAAAAAGAAAMLTRNLGLSHATEEAAGRKGCEKPQDKTCLLFSSRCV